MGGWQGPLNGRLTVPPGYGWDMVRSVDPLRRVQRLESFVQAIVAGGISLVAGLWTVELSASGSPMWVIGGALVLVGVVGIAWGIWRELSI